MKFGAERNVLCVMKNVKKMCEDLRLVYSELNVHYLCYLG